MVDCIIEKEKKGKKERKRRNNMRKKRVKVLYRKHAVAYNSNYSSLKEIH
jgi:hypothetical protein